MFRSSSRNSSRSTSPLAHRQINSQTPRLTFFRFTLLAMCLSALAVAAQGQTDTALFTQGSQSTNTMKLQVPLGNYPGRGVSLPINLTYSSKVWRLGFLNRIYWTSGGYNSLAEAIYAENSTAGWTTSLDVPVVEWPKQNDCYYQSGKAYTLGTQPGFTFRVAQVFIHMPDGSTHTLRRDDQIVPDTGSVPMTGTFWAVDGSRMRYDSANGGTPATLFLADGTRYEFIGGTDAITKYIDRNGNTLVYSGTSRQWTDTLGRTIGMPWPVNPQPIAEGYPYALPGLNGTITYTLKFKLLSDVLAPDSPARIPVADFYLPNPAQPATNYNGGNFTQTTTGSSMFVSGYGDPEELDYTSYTRVIGRGQPGNTAFNPVVLAEIDLPNGQSYQFLYNNYGELTKVTYPTGGYERYQYGEVPALGNPPIPYPQMSRGLTSRWVSANGLGTDEAQWLYGFSGGLSVTAPGPTGAPDGIKTVTSIFGYGGTANNNFGYDSALSGLGFDERVYAPAAQGGAMIRRTLTEWEVSSHTYARPNSLPGTYTAQRNARPKKTMSIILDTGGAALMTASTHQYDLSYEFTAGADLTQSSEYGFSTIDQTTAQTAAITAITIDSNSLLRSSETAYLTSNSNYRDRNILGLVSSRTVKNAAGTIVSQTTYNYDEYSLLTYGSVTGWANPANNYRANVTSTNRRLDVSGSPTWLSSHGQYDQCGSLRTA